MRFSLRSLLFWTTLLCIVIGWVQYHQIDYRWLWPPYRHEVVGFLLVALAYRARAELALPWAIAGLLVLLAGSVWVVHLPMLHSSSHEGNFPGDESFIHHVRQHSAFCTIYPVVALLLCARLALQCRKVFTKWQQALLAVPVVIGSLQLLCTIYLVYRFARGV